ncbi:kielin/chordin-like protein [Lytechinus pictus]|uniref:kielin/chordin-like protein n=1 Tax=Lytechinus pictus TaxID=7653 RepID=UPI0030B9CD88
MTGVTLNNDIPLFDWGGLFIFNRIIFFCFPGIDLLEVFKSGNFTKGITQEQGPLPHSKIWRLRPKTNLINIPPHQIAPLRNQLMRSHAFSVYFLARQLEQTSGMLFSISSLEGRVLFTLTSSSRTGEMRIRYRTRESESLLQTVLPTPLIDSARFAHTLLIVDGDHLTLFTECKSSVDVTLEGVVNFDLRDDATVTIGQGPLGRNKFNGWLQEMVLYPLALTDKPWTCSQDSVAARDGDIFLNDQPQLAELQSRETLIIEPRQNDGPAAAAALTQGESDRIQRLETSVRDLTNMVNMLKAQVSILDQRLIERERCECRNPDTGNLLPCFHQGQQYSDGDSWYPDPCTACRCQRGESVCSVDMERQQCREPCAINPCLNGGTCQPLPMVGTFVCICPPTCTGSQCEHKINVCALPLAYGDCDAVGMIRYFYNYNSMRCEPFEYTGCGGNNNNFRSERDCQEQCMMGACCRRNLDYQSGSATTPAGFTCMETTLSNCRDQTTAAQPLTSREQSLEVTAFHPGMLCANVSCDLPGDKCMVAGEYAAYAMETFRSGCQSCQCLTGGRVQCRCENLTTRKEVRDMTRLEMDLFQSAIRQLQSSGPESRWSHMRDLYMKHVMEAHSQASFLVWHRNFLREVERMLQDIDCRVALPYYDFTTDVGNLSHSIVWQPNFFGGDGVGPGSCVPDHPFRSGGQWDPCLARQFQSTAQLPSKIDVAQAMSSTDFATFESCLQAIIGHVYSYIGGHIASSAAPYDPIFLALQSYVDMLFWRWQQMNGNANSYPVQAREVPMVPFGMRPMDVMSSEAQLCVTYALQGFGHPCNNTGLLFDDQGYDAEGYNRNGFDRFGFDRFGYDIGGRNRFGQVDPREIYIYSGYDLEGYDRRGYDRRGYNRFGFNVEGINRDGFDVNGYDRRGFNRYGFDRNGYDERGFNPFGYHRSGVLDATDFYNNQGYNYQCLDRSGVNQDGYDQFGFNSNYLDASYCNYTYAGPHSLRLTYHLDELLFKQNVEFLRSIPRTCPLPVEDPVLWYEQTWLMSPKDLPSKSSVLGISHFPLSTYSRRFCLDVEPLISNCPCDGEPVVCDLNPCDVGCGGFENAVCFLDFCNECQARWYREGNPVNCGLEVNDCVNGTVVHQSGSLWKPDACTTCTCTRGTVDCERDSCLPTLCDYPSTPFGECCPVCYDCQYGGQLIINRETIVPLNDNCAVCECRNGNVRCQTTDCPRPQCTHPLKPRNGCCPECNGCDYEGRRLSNGETFSGDVCTSCTCTYGSVTCEPLQCPSLSCLQQMTPTGECCPRCADGCEYEGMEFSNGDFFTPMSNPCLRCSCLNNIVRCNPLPCEDAPCPNPVLLLGACCPICTDKCVYNGRTYNNNARWVADDQCQQCRCQDSKVTCTDLTECRVECQHGHIAEGQCCSDCTDCSYEGQFRRNGDEFSSANECSTCRCHYGTVRCQRRPCPSTGCRQEETLDGECCPVCRGCLDRSGTRHDHGARFIPPYDVCSECSCEEGRLTCQAIQCTDLCSHPVINANECCPVCDSCQDGSTVYANGDVVQSPERCQTCRCSQGSIICDPVTCPQVSCSNPVRMPGQCCPECRQCVFEGTTYQNEEEFISQRDPCQRCRCEVGEVRCTDQRTQGLVCGPPCSHPVQIPGQCCPECSQCEYDGRIIPDGMQFRHFTDPCQICTCSRGSVVCEPETCPPAQCSNPVYVNPDDCCPRCQVCVDAGREYHEGERWESSSDPCLECSCQDLRVSCEPRPCPAVQCTHPGKIHSMCCAECSDCEYDRRYISNGQVFGNPLNRCERCTCLNGNIICEPQECPLTLCQQPYTPEGQCCPVCRECFYSGVEYQEGERFTSQQNPCVECICRSGEVTCEPKPCPPANCPYPMRETCCATCDGCFYNGRNHDNGALFLDTSQDCRECQCVSGDVLCTRPLCPELVNCEIERTPPGECCPICEVQKQLTCSFGDQNYNDGDTFYNPINNCQRCECRNGKVECADSPCPDVSCTHPLRFGCCPSCDGCTYGNESYANGVVFAEPDNACGQCACEGGSVTCSPLSCPPLNCPHKTKPEGVCCEICIDLDCVFLGETFLHGKRFTHPQDVCQECVCDDGNTDCTVAPCPTLDCPYPKRGPCCEQCEGCLYNGDEFNDGDVFFNPIDHCQECECQSGFVNCRPRTCPEVTCEHPVTISGDCCPVCDGCLYLGRPFENGGSFRNPQDVCQSCTCRDGNVICERAECPIASCPFPGQDQCGCPTCATCNYNNIEYTDGAIFPHNNDSCRECICRQGDVDCRIRECPQPRCFHPIQLPGRCCPSCDGCTYDENNYENGLEFTDTVDSCRICTCLNGNVNCATRPCNVVSCTHPMQDACNCPSCDGCMYEDVMAVSGMTFMDPNNMCRDCLCLQGSVSCIDRPCPPVNCTTPLNVPGECCPSCPEDVCGELESLNPCQECECVEGAWRCVDRPCGPAPCPNPGSDGCCRVCDSCMYGGKPWANGDSFPAPEDQCRTCQCNNGFVSCQDPTCPSIACSHPVIPAGQCCPVCTGQCTVDGITYDNGENFTPATDYCQRCNCRNGQVYCDRITCSQLCAHPQEVPGQCCPVCEGCFFENLLLSNGQSFRHPSDVCQSCMCINGNVDCQTVNCPTLTCPNPERAEGECCGRCLECTYNDQQYQDGAVWFPVDRQCTQCECIGDQVTCGALECPETRCTHAVKGTCCAICDGCLFEERLYNSGENFRPDDCRQCNCVNGNVLCIEQECPLLTCANRVRDIGQCCERCAGCTYEGFEYSNGESWVSALNPCLTCQCQDGMTVCTEIRCLTPDFCTTPQYVPDQCCPICPGCVYNGVTYNDGQRFNPYNDPCESCHCERGSLLCLRESCPTMADCPAEQVIPPAIGECCATCTAEQRTRECTSQNVGEIFKPYSDPCYTCECKNSSLWECMSEMCPMLSCPRSEQFVPRGECCPRCQRCIDEETGNNYLDGQSWNRGLDNCIRCSCNGGAIECEIQQCESLTCPEGEELYKPQGSCCFACRMAAEPCTYQGIIYQSGDMWLRDECTTCECVAGEVQCRTQRCQVMNCAADETPVVNPGECCPRCILRPATCIAFGDPHYRTFDGKLIHFQGACRYIMTMDCENQDFIVEVTNDDRNMGAVSWTQEVTVIVDGNEVNLGQSGIVQVNNEVVTLPYLMQPFIYIEKRATTFYVNTNSGVSVLWDGSSYVEVSVPGTYARKTCGLCGNFNGYPQDDLRTRSGQLANSVAVFGNSWKVSDQDGCDVKDTDPCTEAGFHARKLANIKCAVLKSHRFTACHSKVPPEQYYAACVYDLCACGSSDTCLCDAVAAYAAECRQEGIHLNWRSSSLCAIDCPADRGFLFDECGPACPRTCANKDIPPEILHDQCLRPCVPGCNCPASKVLHNSRCISESECPQDYNINSTLLEPPI